jgi:general secretion pathway protein D
VLPAPGPTQAATNPAVVEAVSTNTVSSTFTNLNPQDGLRLNFRGVPLEMVLNYLSEAAGFVIVLETDVRGKVDVWSNTPVSKEEAVTLLNSVLNRNGYAAIRNDRTLTIVARDSAKTRDIPVKRGSDPNEIPKNDEVVTQIIPVRYVNATQLTKDLQPLMPMAATMTANEGGNALVITDTQTSIRRMAEIVKALDTSVAAISAVRVFPLRYADAKTVATVIKDVFQSQDSSQRSGNDMRAQFMARFRGGPFGGGGPGGGDGAGDSGSGGGRASLPKVVATSDDRSNSLVVSAPDEMMPTIEEVVKAVDTNVEDVTEVRVFRLKYADPSEMADLLASLFPDDTRSDSNNRNNNFRFGGGPGGMFGGGRQNTTAGQQSDRQKKMGRVLAVADQRTSSVVVSAARDLMTQIGAMIEQLDANPAKKQKVYVYSLENADVLEVEQILRNMFDRNGTSNSRNNANQTSALNTRSSQQQQSTIGTGSSTMGGSRGLSGSGSLGGGF